MDTLLVSVTLISLALATGLAFVAWKLLRDSRTRALARVEMLAALADDVDLSQVDPTPILADDEEGVDDVPERRSPPNAREEVHYAREAEGAGYDVFRAAPAAAARAAALAARAVETAAPERVTPGDILFRHINSDDHDLESLERPASTLLFRAAPNGRAGHGAALAAAAAIVLLGTASLFAFKPGMLASLKHDAAAAQPASPLELLSLRNGNDSGEFTVTGLVQNPTGAPVLKGVVAVVYLFDADGKYFASGKAPIDSASLQPGEESPFVVKIPSAAGVSRYRVGFRTVDGTVIAHVDHRGDAPAGATGVEVGPGQPSIESQSTRPGASHAH